MGYLEDFQAQIDNRDFSKFMQLWEEYCTSDRVEAVEFIELLRAIRMSDFAKMFGQFVETALPLWKTFQDADESYQVLKHLIDLQTTNTSILADSSLEAIKNRYGDHPLLNERLRLIGLRTRDNFHGALSHYDLLDHIGVGKFVFHTGGWGTGEIMDISLVREQMAVEFENVAGRKHITFVNAFKMLSPLPDNNFLARRFSNPDALEKEAKEDPVAIIKILLRDIGPKTAGEIKDELCDLVIPEKEWAKWWQGARAKLKKDSMIQAPESLKDVFSLRKTAVSQEERLEKAIHSKTDADEIIQTSYNFVRDLPKTLKKQEANQPVKTKLLNLFKGIDLTQTQELQILILLEDYFSSPVEGKHLKDFVQTIKDVSLTIEAIEIIALKKKALMLVREFRKDWIALFSSFLHSTQQGTLRDYIMKELIQGETRTILEKDIERLIRKPAQNPELFFWYFQKATGKDGLDLPFADRKGHCLLFEAFFILLSTIESKPEYKELTKKMYTLILAKRYALVRQLLEGTSMEFVKEFLLLVSKCQTFNDHDLTILRSLAEVVHPSLGKPKTSRSRDPNVIWTTEAGYLRTQERAKQIGTSEIIDNAREIEAARALGDLRENSEYKFALERRSRLQGELKALSDQLGQARLITPADISSTEIGIGNVVEVTDQKNKRITYTILGPWEADPDQHILSFQSKLAQTMHGLKVGDSFTFRDEEFQITAIKNYLEVGKK
ncbi:MAG: GreA/GreB family elongation factor [Parachlamydiaceae bacterium]